MTESCGQTTLSTPQEEAKGNLDSELAIVISSISLACKQIASLVNRAGISNLTGLAGAANIQVRHQHIGIHWTPQAEIVCVGLQ